MEDRLGFGASRDAMRRIEVSYVRELAVAPPPEVAPPTAAAGTAAAARGSGQGAARVGAGQRAAAGRRHRHQGRAAAADADPAAAGARPAATAAGGGVAARAAATRGERPRPRPPVRWPPRRRHQRPVRRARLRLAAVDPADLRDDRQLPRRGARVGHGGVDPRGLALPGAHGGHRRREFRAAAGAPRQQRRRVGRQRPDAAPLRGRATRGVSQPPLGDDASMPSGCACPRAARRRRCPACKTRRACSCS